MKLDVKGVFNDAWRMAKRDYDLLLGVGGFFLFLPQFAVFLLVPHFPEMPASSADEAAVRVAAETVAQWFTDNGLLLVACNLCELFGALVLFMLYLRRGRPELKKALPAALLLLPRYLLVSILVSLPVAFIVMPAIGLILFIPAIYAFGRMLLSGAALVGEQPLGAIGAVKRSIELSRGHGLALAGIAVMLLFSGYILAEPFVALGRTLEGAPMANPVSAALLDALAAAAASLATTAAILVEIALYRRLSASKGI